MYLKKLPEKNPKRNITKEGSGLRRSHDCHWRHLRTRSVATRRGTRSKQMSTTRGIFFQIKRGGGMPCFCRGPIAVFALGTLFAKFHCSADFWYRDAEILQKSVPAKKFSDSRCLHCVGFRPIVWVKGVIMVLPYSLTGWDLFGLE